MQQSAADGAKWHTRAPELHNARHPKTIGSCARRSRGLTYALRHHGRMRQRPFVQQVIELIALQLAIREDANVPVLAFQAAGFRCYCFGAPPLSSSCSDPTRSFA